MVGARIPPPVRRGWEERRGRPRTLDQRVRLAGYPQPVRQIAVDNIGPQSPTLLLTNQHKTTVAEPVDHYAALVLVENTIAETIDFFHSDTLSSAVPLKVAVDLQLTLLGGTLYRLLGERTTSCSKRRASPRKRAPALARQPSARLRLRLSPPWHRICTLIRPENRPWEFRLACPLAFACSRACRSRSPAGSAYPSERPQRSRSSRRCWNRRASLCLAFRHGVRRDQRLRGRCPEAELVRVGDAPVGRSSHGDIRRRAPRLAVVVLGCEAGRPARLRPDQAEADSSQSVVVSRGPSNCKPTHTTLTSFASRARLDTWRGAACRHRLLGLHVQAGSSGITSSRRGCRSARPRGCWT